jgi:hypothetical protein
MAAVDICQSCGMPMHSPELHGGGIEQNPYCIYCTDAEGHLKSREDVREGMVQFYMDTMGQARADAEAVVDATMAAMPAWKEG